VRSTSDATAVLCAAFWAISFLLLGHASMSEWSLLRNPTRTMKKALVRARKDVLASFKSARQVPGGTMNSSTGAG